MGKKVKNLTIEPQSGSDRTYFASWSFTYPKVLTSTGTIKAGVLVSIKSGASYYNGVSIPSWVMSDTWYVVQVSGDRAVLGKNTKGDHDIQSPINIKYLQSTTSSASVIPSESTDHFVVKWYYTTGDGVWFDGGSSDIKIRNATYSPPSNAKKIKVSVKPVSKKYKVNNKEISYWTGTAVSKTHLLSIDAPSTPSAPKVTISKYKLTASIGNISDARTDKVEFKVYKGNKVFKTGTATVKTARVSFSCTVNPGEDYRVKCRAININKSKTPNAYSSWSEYSDSIGTMPATPSGWEKVKALSETSVLLNWYGVKNATNYEVQYTDQKRYFDSSSEVKTLTVEGVGVSHAEVTGLETGKEWFFRVRAINGNGKSGWTDIKSVVIGKTPAAPTTWSSTTTVIAGEPLTLYWVHNSEDGSSQTYAQLEIYINGTKTTETIKNTTDEDEKDKTSSYSVNTSTYVEGTQIKWRVRTKGVTNKYGDWSVQRTVDIYAPPTLELEITNQNGDSLEVNNVATLTSFPFYLKGLAGPKTQSPIGYSVTIIANETYETVDYIGNDKMINEGEVIYSKYFDTTDALLVEFSANNIDLENGVSYTISCVVSMNSGLTAESSLNFTVSWTDEIYEPDAGVSIDDEQLVAFIKPYCVDEDEILIDNVTLSVYRREFDGTFTEIGTGLSNNMDVTVIDPHPALDYARYRIVATSEATGAVSFYDVPGYPVSEKSVVVQWDEQWTNFDVTGEDELEQPPWTGSMLKIPYNIDVSDSHKPDIALIEYVGREHPVSYYGTQLGETSTWSVEIPKEDKDTLYALRRLAKWMSDVYVREPSGSGYWASITVSYSQTHRKLTIPITMNITRVEGGA